jgi:hypothetical protein
MIAKLKIPIAVAVIMIVEGAVLWFVLPAKAAPADAAVAKKEEAEEKIETVEKEVGKFSTINAVNPEGELKIDCMIAVETNKKFDKEAADAFKNAQHKMKEAINVTIRKAQQETLLEPSLGTLKRQLREALKEVVGKEKELVHAVIVSEFKAVPQ